MTSGTATQISSALEFAPLPTAVPCARLHAVHVLHEWGLHDLARRKVRVDRILLLSDLCCYTQGDVNCGVNLSPYVGQQVQISAATVKPGHHDADVKIEDKTTVDPEHGRDTTSRSKTKIEVPRTAYGQYTVVSVKPLGSTCPAQ